MSSLDLYLVEISSFAGRYYLKKFSNKYPGVQWQMTLRSIIGELERFDESIKTDKLETISVSGDLRLVKQYFRVAKTTDSAKAQETEPW